ncbi:MAG: Arabinose metabolism transcriptional repressor [bacterium ADurb.Bin429]|nr:MAG: Arabinose metabolism transcriptional repressor [bacterium ADurb.Bin429]
MRRACRDRGLGSTALHELPIAFGPSFPPHHLDPAGEDAADHPLVAYLRAHPEITGILARNDAAACRIANLFARVGWTVPGDYSLIGYDDVDALRDDAGRNILTSMRVPLEEIGQTAVELLTRLIAANTTSAEHIILPTELIVRGTTGTPRA